MYLKGRIKLGLKNAINAGNEYYELRNYIDALNQKYTKERRNFQTTFYLKNDGEFKNKYEETFDEIMNSIMNDDANTNNAKKKDDLRFTFHIDYFVRTYNDKVKEIEIKNQIDNFIKNCKVNLAGNKSVNILKHNISIQKNIDAFDELVYNKPSELKNFYKGLLNEKDIAVLSETYATCKIVKKDISSTKYYEEALINKYKNICIDDKIANEIHRIYRVDNNKNIQGVNYLFNEDNYDLRQNTYKVLASALYSNGRLDNPYYYIVDIDVNDKNTKSNLLYLKTRLKISRNDIYFFEFSKKTDNQNNSFFDSNFANFCNESNNFFETIKENQFVNIFGIYADFEAKETTSTLEEKELIDILSLVVFNNKLNKESQLLYVKEKLKNLNNIDLVPVINDIIEYQSTQCDGLTTKELDNYVISVLKSKYDKVYRPVYKNVTKDMTNGDMLKKLMNMIGFTNFKNEVSEMCNKIDFRNLKEDLIPATKILNQMSNYERNNWILMGVPGTGKSTAAEILEKVMYQERIIKKDIIVKFTPSKLNSEVVVTPFGPMNIQTSDNLHESFMDSVGGVLIVDEIGHLKDEDKSLLLQLMEDYKRDVCVVLCGYENEAKALLDYNPGFRSRFTHIVKMEEYTTDELIMILEQKLKDKHFTLKEDAKEELIDLINDARQVNNFGHARFMESLCDKLISIHSNNKLKYIHDIMEKNEDINFDEKSIYEIDKEDIANLPLDEMLGDEYVLAKKHKDSYSELHNLIGCNQVKTAVDEFISKSVVDKLKMDRKLLDKYSFNMNMVFYGNPGTAKTTVARLIARIMVAKGLLNKNKVLEVGASDLVAAYVGQTAIKTTEVFKAAKGGVLFIDEAYSLANKAAGGYNQEAIDTIIKEMENNRNDTMVIFAGYKDKMEEFIKCNPGFKSRISKFIDFPNYDINELIQIFKKICNDNKYMLDKANEEKILNKISNYLEEVKSDKQFGNGRVCRTILENAVNRQSNRVVNIKDISDEDLMTLKYEDFDFLGEDKEFGKEHKNQIGFKVA